MAGAEVVTDGGSVVEPGPVIALGVVVVGDAGPVGAGASVVAGEPAAVVGIGAAVVSTTDGAGWRLVTVVAAG